MQDDSLPVVGSGLVIQAIWLLQVLALVIIDRICRYPPLCAVGWLVLITNVTHSSLDCPTDTLYDAYWFRAGSGNLKALL